MLANNNKMIINKLAKNSVKSNKKQYGILFFTIVLSAFMLFCVFTIGWTYLDSSRLQNTRLNGAEYDITTMNGFTSKQVKSLQSNKNIQNVGMESYAGFIKSSEFDNTVEIGLLWCDETFWNNLMSPARTKLDGHYPQNKNELMVTKDILKACGNENLSVGDSIVLTYENNTGVHTDKFVISGIWDGYGDKSAGFVSKNFYDETGYDLKNDGILCIKLNRNYVLPTTIQSLEKSLNFSDRQIFAPTDYIENSFKLLSVFYCLTTIISSQGERTVLPNYWNADFVVQNQTQTTENINSLKPAIEDSFVEKIEKMDGMKDIHLVEGVPISFPYVSKGFSDMWITNYIERTPYVSSKDVITNYKTNPSNYYGMLIGIDEDQFDYVNQSLSSPVDKQDFLNGKSCIVQYEGSEIPKEYLNQKVPFSFDGKQYEITVEAVSYETQYSGRDIGASLIVSQNYLKSLTSKPTILDVYIYYNQKYDEVLEKKITSLINNSPYSNDLYVESQYENMKTIQEAQGNMMEIGTIIALLLLFVGVLNYANTIASGIQNRRLIFSVMESIGMSRKQINQLLIREGILYAIFSIFVTLTIGSAITYVCFQSMNYMRIPFKVPVIPLISSIILVVLICTLVPLLSYKKLGGNHSIVERLRNCE